MMNAPTKIDDTTTQGWLLINTFVEQGDDDGVIKAFDAAFGSPLHWNGDRDWFVIAVAMHNGGGMVYVRAPDGDEHAGLFVFDFDTLHDGVVDWFAETSRELVERYGCPEFDAAARDTLGDQAYHSRNNGDRR